MKAALSSAGTHLGTRPGASSSDLESTTQGRVAECCLFTWPGATRLPLVSCLRNRGHKRDCPPGPGMVPGQARASVWSGWDRVASSRRPVWTQPTALTQAGWVPSFTLKKSKSLLEANGVGSRTAAATLTSEQPGTCAWWGCRVSPPNPARGGSPGAGTWGPVGPGHLEAQRGLVLPWGPGLRQAEGTPGGRPRQPPGPGPAVLSSLLQILPPASSERSG